MIVSFIFGVSRLKIRNWVDDAENLLYSFSQYPFIHSRIISPSVSYADSSPKGRLIASLGGGGKISDFDGGGFFK